MPIRQFAKLWNMGKYKYDLQKKANQAKKKQKIVSSFVFYIDRKYYKKYQRIRDNLSILQIIDHR